MFSTIAHEKSDFSSKVIEVQLAHKIGTRVSQAYNMAQYLDYWLYFLRGKLMNIWRYKSAT
jgi:hypothetical protein